VLTIVEYIFAGEVDDALIRFIGLAIASLAKAGLIVYYFMHIYQLWRREEAH
jgi:cytochrome c oxidase subunit IV